VITKVLVYLAVGCCALITVSFGMFALDQASGASTQQVQQLSSDTADASVQSATAPAKSQPRRFIDGATRALTSPFSALLSSMRSPWAQESVVTVLGLLVYGFGLGYLARFSRGLA
jgi:hypothetical protein